MYNEYHDNGNKQGSDPRVKIYFFKNILNDWSKKIYSFRSDFKNDMF